MQDDINVLYDHQNSPDGAKSDKRYSYSIGGEVTI